MQKKIMVFGLVLLAFSGSVLAESVERIKLKCDWEGTYKGVVQSGTHYYLFINTKEKKEGYMDDNSATVYEFRMTEGGHWFERSGGAYSVRMTEGSLSMAQRRHRHDDLVKINRRTGRYYHESYGLTERGECAPIDSDPVVPKPKF